jgi:hypothetical protein
MGFLSRTFLNWGVFAILAGLVVAFSLSPYLRAFSSCRRVAVQDKLFRPDNMFPYRSRVVRSERDLQKLLLDMHAPMKHFVWDKGIEEYWLKRCRAFELAVRAARLDFSKESLVLIPHQEPSGSIEVGMSMPDLRSKELNCRIWRKRPGACNDDMGYHCFAMIVKNDKIDQVRISVDGEHKESISISH